jgi:hypothetical protein
VATTGEIVGRDQELAEVERFLDAAAKGPTTLVLKGEPGSGRDRQSLVPRPWLGRPNRARAVDDHESGRLLLSRG